MAELETKNGLFVGLVVEKDKNNKDKTPEVGKNDVERVKRTYTKRTEK